MKHLQRLGAMVAATVILLAIYGGKAAYSDINGAVEVFDIKQVWRTWNTILVVFQMAGISYTIYLFAKLTSGKRYVLVEPAPAEDEIVEVWQDEGDDWTGKRTVSRSQLPSEYEVMKELKNYGSQSADFWSRQATRPEVKQYKAARMYCLSERQKSGKKQQDSPSPTYDLSLK